MFNPVADLSTYRTKKSVRTTRATPYYHHIDLIGEPVTTYQSIIHGIVKAYTEQISKPAIPEVARQFTVQAETYFDNKQCDKAETAYRMAINTAPWAASAYFNAAMLLGEELKQHPAAINAMQWYLDLEPNAKDSRQATDKIYEW